MKIATDIKQSEQLARILPIESADMFYGTIAPYEYSDRMYDGGIEDIPLPKAAKKSSIIGADEYDGEIPAWSLSALLKLLDSYTLQTTSDGKCFIVADRDENTVLSTEYDEPVDACCEVINKLHIKGLL